MPNYTLRKVPQFHLISWCGNFPEKHNLRKLLLSTNLHTGKLGEITVFYAVARRRRRVKSYIDNIVPCGKILRSVHIRIAIPIEERVQCSIFIGTHGRFTYPTRPKNNRRMKKEKLMHP